MTAVSHDVQLGSLAGLKGVRIHLTTNNRHLIPNWVEEREKTASKSSGPSEPVESKIIEERGVLITGFLFALMRQGFAIVRTNVQKAKGSNLRLGITLERDGVSIPDEHIADLMELMREGRWDVRVDRNGPIGRVDYEHLQVSARNRTFQKVASDRLLGVSQEGSVVLF